MFRPEKFRLTVKFKQNSPPWEATIWHFKRFRSRANSLDCKRFYSREEALAWGEGWGQDVKAVIDAIAEKTTFNIIVDYDV